ncbi:MAG: gliding motility protein GldL [Porphyromonadaceae bacterium]|nr:gliding motility protein GldL [Porphyromonadaceae bacterium]
MKPYRRYKNKLEMFLASNRGKRILNLFYSWGAAFVILGALFKLLHLPYGNEILFVSMMTEFFVFFVSGFEKPAPTYNWEEVFPELNSTNPMDREEMEARRVYLLEKAQRQQELTATGAMSGTSPITNAGGYPTSRATTTSVASDLLPEEELERLSSGITALGEAAQQLSRIARVSTDMMGTYQAMASDYESLSKGSQQYLQQMETLARNVSGLNTIYEIQLKGISSQIDAIDKINSGLHQISSMYDSSVVDSHSFRSENERMAQQLRQLNQVYARMLEALTINMGMPGAPGAPYTSHQSSTTQD